MDGPLIAAINAPLADALLQYRSFRLPSAKAIAAMNGYAGAYWPWQSAYTGFERTASAQCRT
jgi:trehalose/maltose hydrolase-like predicted phosphorylase